MPDFSIPHFSVPDFPVLDGRCRVEISNEDALLLFNSDGDDPCLPDLSAGPGAMD